tara:strand:+ start:3513 stop:9269 length:5757 start_codon:yes stop_codon:yes gene_type:complete
MPFIFILPISSAQAIDLATDYIAVPPLVDASSASDKPNVLMVIDNSNSMDEEANGSAVGSDNESSKSEIARVALKNIINNFGDASRLGLMAYQQSGVSLRHIHNSPYDVSFDPLSFYDPDRDGNIDDIPRDSNIKKYRIPNPTNAGANIYYNIALPFYAGSNQGNAFCRSNTADFDNGSETVSGPWDYYQCYRNKTTANDDYNSGFSSYMFGGRFSPTDSDYAQNILDFGRFMSWLYVGRTWFSNTSPGKGMLHVGIADVDSSQKTKLLNKLATSQFSTTTDTPLRNAGLTPIEGTLKSAKSYFQGALPASEIASGASGALPAGNVCGNANDYVVLVTDGLPSVDASGNQTTNTSVAVAAAAAAAADLLSSQNVKTFVVGFALPNGVDASVLNQIAIAGGTSEAYQADDEASLNQALGSIFLSIINRTSSSTGAAVLANNTRGEGAVYQASYNPRMKDAQNRSVSWVGGLQGLFIDQLGYLREDSNGNKALDGYDTDNIVEYFYDTSAVPQRTRIRYFTGASATIAPDTSLTPTGNKEVSELSVLWQARDQLALLTDTTSQRDYTASASTGRHIVTSIEGTSLTDFVVISSADQAAAEATALAALNLASSAVVLATASVSAAELSVPDFAEALAVAELEEAFRSDIYTTVDAFYKLELAEQTGNATSISVAQLAVDEVLANNTLMANLVLAEKDKTNSIDKYDAALTAYSASTANRIAKEALEATAQSNFDIADGEYTLATGRYEDAVEAFALATTAKQDAIDAVPGKQATYNATQVVFEAKETVYNATYTDADDEVIVIGAATTTRDNAVSSAATAQTTYNNADTAFTTAQTAYNNAVTSANSAEITRDNAVSAATSAQTAYNTAVTTLTNAQTAYDSAVTAAGTALTARDNAVGAATTAQTNYDTANTAFTIANTDYNNAVTIANSAETARDNAVNAAATAQTDYNTALTAAGGDLTDLAVVAAQTALDAANLLVTNTNVALANANQAETDRQSELVTATTTISDANDALAAANLLVANTNTMLTTANQAETDRQGELTAATTARSDANDTLAAANLLVTNTNATLTTANQAETDRQGELTTATTNRLDASNALNTANELVTNSNTALSDLQEIIADFELATTNRDNARDTLDDAEALVVTTTEDKENANQAILDRQAELTTAFNDKTTEKAALDLAIGVREQAETDEATAFAAIAPALADIAPKTTAAAAADQAQADFYGKGLLNIDAGNLSGEYSTASANLTTATEDLTTATGNASVTATNLLNANTTLAQAIVDKISAQSAYDAAVLAVLNQNVFLNYLMESSGTEANKLVNYIRGEEQTGYRSRSIDIYGDTDAEVWRLGDIVHSTPALVGAPGDRYDVLYSDTTYAVYREQYKNRRQVVYVGANDGMLHAFNAGFWNESAKKFELDDSFVNSSSSLTNHPLGSEIWSYVPRSVLPHLKWLKDSGYAHSYYVDGEPLIFDANIFPVDAEHPYGWGTVLVVGLRFGGGEINVDSDGDGVNDTQTYPSYILMDVTNPEASPRLIAEISHSELGFTTSKPAVVKNRVPKIGTDYSTTDSNDWQLVFGSGPTLLADATSDQNAKLFVYDLVDKSFVTGFSPKDLTSQSASFVGDIGVANWDDDFVDDTAYFGVIGGSPNTPTGQVMRYRLDQIGASAVTTLVDTNRATVGKPLTVVDGTGRKWIYFGTGRLFDGDDNPSTPLQRYYGVMEPIDTTGVTTWNAVDMLTLQDVSAIRIFDNGDLTTTSGTVEIPNGTSITNYNALKSALPKYKGGWFRNLYQNSTEPTGRNISASAKSRSIIFFTEYKPANNYCQPEGTSLLYGVDYQTGTAVPFAVFGVDSSVTNNYGDLSETAVDLGQGMASAPKIIENNSGGRSGSSDPTVSILTQSSTGVLQVDLATVGTFATGRASWMQIELD